MQLQKSGVFPEIMDQPRAWKETLQSLLKRREELMTWLKAENFGQVLYIGSGSAYSVAHSASSISQLVSGLNTVVLPSCELLYLRRPPYDSRIKTLIVPIAQTGNEEDTVWATEKLRRLHPACKVLGISAQEGNLKQYTDQFILLPKTLEESNVCTRSASSALLACMVITSWLANKEVFINELAKVCDLFNEPNFLKTLQDKARKLSVPKPLPTHFSFLGTGPYFGVALEAARKIREMTQITADTFSTLEYRNNNFVTVTKEQMIINFVSDTVRRGELDVLAGLSKFRPVTVAVLEATDEYAAMRSDQIIELHSKVSEVSRILLIYPLIHLISFYMSIAKGKNPERLMHLDHKIPIKDKPGV